MAYSRTLFVVRAYGDLPAPLSDRDHEVLDGPRARRGDGWQVIGVPGNLVVDGAMLSDLAARTGTPVLAGCIDGDTGWLGAVSPGSEPWKVWLEIAPRPTFRRRRLHHIEASAVWAARSIVARQGLPLEDGAEYAVRWAADAGYRAPARPIHEILTTGRPPRIGGWLRLPWHWYASTEENFFDIVDRVGIPRRTPTT
jgi:hypothetical protein